MDEGERARLEKAYRAFGQDLWRAIFVFSGGVWEIADHAVAEAFVRAGSRVGAIRELHPWLYRVAFRLAAGELRARRRTVALEVSRADPPGPVEGVGDLLEMLNRLTPMQRGAFVLRVVFDQSSRDAARALGISEVACRVHLHGARVRLRGLLKEVERI